MRTQFATVLFAAILPLWAHASQPQSIELVIDCAHKSLPSQTEVARFTGIDDFSAAFAARARLTQQAGRECQRGVASVTLLLEPLDSDSGSTRRLAAANPATP